MLLMMLSGSLRAVLGVCLVLLIGTRGKAPWHPKFSLIWNGKATAPMIYMDLREFF